MTFENIYDMIEDMQEHCQKYKCGVLPADLPAELKFGYVADNDENFKSWEIKISDYKKSAAEEPIRYNILKVFFNSSDGRVEMCKWIKEGKFLYGINPEVLTELLEIKTELHALKYKLKNL